VVVRLPEFSGANALTECNNVTWKPLQANGERHIEANTREMIFDDWRSSALLEIKETPVLVWINRVMIHVVARATTVRCYDEDMGYNFGQVWHLQSMKRNELQRILAVMTEAEYEYILPGQVGVDLGYGDKLPVGEVNMNMAKLAHSIIDVVRVPASRRESATYSTPAVRGIYRMNAFAMGI
jgi:hypothetical protein